MLVHSYFARQPILDRDQRIEAYEVLYRAGPKPGPTVVGGDQATAAVLTGLFGEVEAVDRLAGRRGFVNMPRRLLVDDTLLSFDPGRLAAEILEDVPVDGEVMDALRRLRSHGFTVALDDFVPEMGRDELMTEADIVKLDVRDAGMNVIADRVATVKRKGLVALAEKVETADEFRDCRSLGFDLFQGYFFARPELVSGRRVAPTQQTLLRLMVELQSPDATIASISDAVAAYPNLAFQVVKLVNSTAVGVNRRVSSLRDAVVLVGLKRLASWVSLLVLNTFDGKAPELVTIALTRARTCEGLAATMGSPDPEAFFTVGLLSVVDALTDLPMDQALAGLSLDDDMRAALIEHAGPKGRALAAAIAFERASFDAAEHLGLGVDEVADAYVRALDWADALVRSASAA